MATDICMSSRPVWSCVIQAMSVTSQIYQLTTNHVLQSDYTTSISKVICRNRIYVNIHSTITAYLVSLPPNHAAPIPSLQTTFLVALSGFQWGKWTKESCWSKLRISALDWTRTSQETLQGIQKKPEIDYEPSFMNSIHGNVIR